jgi:hypothetical protein
MSKTLSISPVPSLPRYVTVERSWRDLPEEIQKETGGWGYVCENHHGTAYWNHETGEFCWIPQDGQKAKFSRLTK